MADKDKLTLTDSNTDGGFTTPQGPSRSVSTGTIVEKLNTIGISKTPSANARGDKRKAPEHRSDDLPVAKKNRNYLPPATKPIYFELKKFHRKLAQWSAHQAFLENCATTGIAPPSLRLNLRPPWEIADEDLKQQWSKTMNKFPRELCDILAADCGNKVHSCQGSIKSLLQDLAGHIAIEEVGEIEAELKSSFKTAFDKMYAEKILARNNKPRAPSPTKKVTVIANTSGGQNRRAPPNKRSNNKATRRNQGISGRRGRNNKAPASGNNRRQDLMKQLTDLTRIVKQLKN